MARAFFFDDQRGSLAPLTDLRPACAVRTGAFTSFERLRRSLKLEIAGVQTPATLEFLARELLNVPVNDASSVPFDESILFINSRCPLAYDVITSLQPGESIVEAGSGDVVAAMGRGSDVSSLLAGQSPAWRPISELSAPALLSRPWHVKTFRDRCLAADLAMFRGFATSTDLPGVSIIVGPARPGVSAAYGQRPVIHPTARVYPTATFDIEHGPIVVDEHAVVRPHALIVGPAYIGPHSTVLDKSLIKAGAAIGPHCKVAGEVGGTIFQGFANKAHDGHLGDSYIGEWANLGANTTNSNLLNTYGEVIAKPTPSGSNERTGEQFLGCIIGDHCKFAISTRIMTGSIVHTGTMWAASHAVSGCVPAFSWVTDAGVKSFRLDKFMEIARTVMGRRKIAPTQAYEECLRELIEARL